jgi:polyhydroxyalkanoic acid synthase PhaR subunit
MTEKSASKESTAYDPFQLWRQFYEANEEAWTKAVKDMTTAPGYAEMQGKMLESFLSYQKLMRDAMTTQMNTLNIATRDDVSRLGELIVGIEEKVDQIDEALEDLSKQLSSLDERVRRQGKSLEGEIQSIAESDASQGGRGRGTSGGGAKKS